MCKSRFGLFVTVTNQIEVQIIQPIRTEDAQPSPNHKLFEPIRTKKIVKPIRTKKSRVRRRYTGT